jgi:cellulose synthase/poly-beta-1,6-N-acetylglucosamine synthase-like glycosyltransferase
MTEFLTVLLLPVLLYAAFLSRCLLQWSRTDTIKAESGAKYLPEVSVIVPVRNEAGNIGRTVVSVALQDYPSDKSELTVVDDGSTDGTVQAAVAAAAGYPGLRFKVVSAGEEGSKKKAIEAGVGDAGGEWIITTDGDTVAGNAWLRSMLYPAAPEIRLLCGPLVVTAQSTSSLIAKTAAMESLGLTLISAASIRGRRPLFCNGANLAYPKRHFLDLGGYDTGRLSGDDTDLLVKTDPRAIRYVKDLSAVVRTAAPETLAEFLSQRRRWASKIPVAMTTTTLTVAFIVWSCHAALLFLAAAAAIGFIGWPVLLGAWLFKYFFDLAVLKVSGAFFKEKVSPALLLVLEPFYAVAVTVTGISAVLLPYNWKGRKSR